MTTRRNDNRDLAWGTSWGASWVVLAFLLIAMLGIASWGFRVLTAETKGKGDARIAVESGTNRLGQQEFFERTYQDIEQQKGVIAQAQRSLDSGALDPRTAQTNLDGAIQRCLSLVGDYNAQARSQRAEQFRAADLPASIDGLTACQEA
jgi:hypothetical protein